MNEQFYSKGGCEIQLDEVSLIRISSSCSGIVNKALLCWLLVVFLLVILGRTRSGSCGSQEVVTILLCTEPVRKGDCIVETCCPEEENWSMTTGPEGYNLHGVLQSRRKGIVVLKLQNSALLVPFIFLSLSPFQLHRIILMLHSTNKLI